MGISIGGQHFKDTITQFENGDIKSTSPQIVNGNFAIACIFLVQAKSQSGCSRFVDDPLYFKSGNFTRFFGGLTLGVIKIGRYSDHCFVYILP